VALTSLDSAAGRERVQVITTGPDIMHLLARLPSAYIRKERLFFFFEQTLGACGVAARHARRW